MRVKKVWRQDTEGLMIFISSLEKDNEDIKRQIDDYKKLYKEVSIFISGSNSIERVLETIIQEKMN